MSTILLADEYAIGTAVILYKYTTIIFRFYVGIDGAFGAASFYSCSIAKTSDEDEVIEQPPIMVEWAFTPSLENYAERCGDAVTGEIVSTSCFIDGNWVFTSFQVRVISVLAGDMLPGDMFSVAHMGGDINEYEYLVLHGWDNGTFAKETGLEKAKHTTLHFPMITEFGAEPGDVNLFLLSDRMEGLGGSYRSVVLADIGGDVYRFKSNDGYEFTASLEEIAAALSKQE